MNFSQTTHATLRSPTYLATLRVSHPKRQMGRIARAAEGGRQSRVGNKLFEAGFHSDLTSPLSPGAGPSRGSSRTL